MKRNSAIRFVGLAIHLIVAIAATAMGIFAGSDVMQHRGGLTEVGFLVALAVGVHAVGALVFVTYRPVPVGKLILVATEVLIVGVSAWWLAIDFVIAGAVTLLCAVLLARGRDVGATA